MEASTVHTVPGRDLTLTDGEFRTAVDGYRLPLVSWSLQIDAASCEHCGSQIAEPVTVRWRHGLKEADVDWMLTVETGEEVHVVDLSGRKEVKPGKQRAETTRTFFERNGRPKRRHTRLRKYQQTPDLQLRMPGTSLSTI